MVNINFIIDIDFNNSYEFILIENILYNKTYLASKILHLFHQSYSVLRLTDYSLTRFLIDVNNYNQLISNHIE
ncbi:hypothetical protein DERF_002039 [Dermatophagoides farinae]|uniref:Uncharacterized protein n=1 Tax=Dermatophagoides farinae TaxID=6954 RepID=A0A922IBM8_DERFA|nr:hypothetical protein DERF_002039 [Dermatophagoides farinae]